MSPLIGKPPHLRVVQVRVQLEVLLREVEHAVDVEVDLDQRPLRPPGGRIAVDRPEEREHRPRELKHAHRARASTIVGVPQPIFAIGPKM